eukprot:1198292-Prymnesium_polylepis.1
MCGTSFSAGDPIPATSSSTYATSSSGTGATRTCKDTPSAVLFYGCAPRRARATHTHVADLSVAGTSGARVGSFFCSRDTPPSCPARARAADDYPEASSANTGYEVADTTIFYMILDDSGAVYLVLVMDKAGTSPPSNSDMTLDISSTGLESASVGFALYDDWSEQSASTWDGQTGRFSWNWNLCCTDGMALGPLPRSAWSMTFTAVSHSSNMEYFRFGSWSDTANDMEWRDLTATEVGFGTGGVQVTAYTCDAYCATFSSCGDCTASPYCGWCGATATCVDAVAASSCATGYEAPGSCCAACTGLTMSPCMAEAGCCWCAVTSSCISGTAQSPCTACTAAAMSCVAPPPP